MEASLSSLRSGHVWPTARRSLFGILFAFTVFLLCGTAGASWSPSVTVSDTGTRYGFGQDVAPDGTGMVVWSAPLSGGDGYSIFARKVSAAGALGAKVTVSAAAAGAAYSSAYAPTVRYDATGTATVVWLESTYSSDSCFVGSGVEGECVVDEYVRARQISAAGSLAPVRELQHRQTVLPQEGSFGGASPAYVAYAQPVIAGGPAGTMTVLWPESTFGSGCAAYGYSSSYTDSECEADQRVKWIRLSASALPQGTASVAYESHTSGYGSGEPLVRLRAGSANDGTVTVLFRVRSGTGEAGCWGGESAVGFFRVGSDGKAGAAHQLDSGCGATDPDLAVDPGGAAIAVWSWQGDYSDEARYARIDAAGSASASQALLSGEPTGVSGLDVARGPSGSALAVWAQAGDIRSRRIPFSGALAPTALVAARPSGRYFTAPRVAAAPDGSAVLVWEATIDGGSFETALQGIALDPGGTAHSARTLLAPNRRDHGARVSAGPSGSFLASWRLSVPSRNRLQSTRFGTEPAASNDAFANAQPLEAELPSFASGSNVDASKEAGEPSHAGSAGGASVWFTWTPTSSGPVTLTSCASDGLDPALAVYTGGALGSLATVAAAKAGAPQPCSTGDAGVRFEAVAGTTYRVAVDGEGGSEGSFGLKLISREGAPANDDFAAAKAVSGGLPRYLSGTNVEAGKEPGEPSHAGNAGGASVWFSWIAPSGGKTRVSACGWSLSRPLLGVYTGSALGALTEVGSAKESGGCASMSFSAVAGTTYRIAIDGEDGREGGFQLRFEQAPANDNLASAQSLSYLSAYGSNVEASKEAGEPNHAGDPGGASVWYSWTPTADLTAIVSVCLFGDKDKSALLGVYTGSGYGDLKAVGSDAGSGSTEGCLSHKSEVRVDFTAGTKYLIAIDGEGGARASFSLTADQFPANDALADAQKIVGGPTQTIYGFNRHATKEVGEPNHAGSPGGASVWYSWTPSSTGSGIVSACLSGSKSALLGVYVGSSSGGEATGAVYGGGVPSLTDLTEVASAAGNGSKNECGSSWSETHLNFAAGTTYYIAVDGKEGAEGSFTLALETTPANDNFAAAQQLNSSFSSLISGSTRHATKEVGEPNHAGSPGGASVWYSWTAPRAGPVEVGICSYGSLDPLLGLYTGSSLASLTPVASQPVAGSCSRSTTVRFSAVAGSTYRFAVDGKEGSEGSFYLELHARPDNDDFTAARLIEGTLPGSVSGDTHLATKEPGEPNHAGSPGGASVWFTWTPSSSRTVKVFTCSSHFDTLDPVLAVYTGSSLAGLSGVVSNDDTARSGCSAEDSEVRFAATAGTTYRIAVDGKGGGVGAFQLQLSAVGSANDDFEDAIDVFQAPGVVAGNNASAGVQPGEPYGAEQTVWYRLVAQRSELVRLHTCSDGGAPMDVDVFTGSTLNSLSPVAVAAAGSAAGCGLPPGAYYYGDTPVRAFEAVAGTTYWISVDRYLQISPSFELQPAGPFELVVDPPANDLRAGAEPLPLHGGSVARSNVGATREANEEEHAGEAGGASVWFSWFATADGPAGLDTCGSAIDSLLAVEDLEGELVSNGSGAPCAAGSAGSSLGFEAEEGHRYVIAVDGKGGQTGAVRLRLAFATPDTTPPETHLTVPAAINVHQLTFSLSRDEPESSFECSLDATPFAPCELSDQPAGLTGTLTGLVEGPHTLAVREVDAAGNPDPTPELRGFKVDTVPPQTSFASGPEGLTRWLESFGLAADEPASFFECALDGASLSYCSSPYVLPDSLPDGQHTVRAVAIDQAGNRDPSPATRTFVLDRTAPVASIDEGPEGTVGADEVEFEFSADEEGTFDCLLDDKFAADCESPRSYSGLTDAVHQFEVIPTDLAGNVGAPAERTFRVEARPPETTIKSGPPAYTPSTTAKFTFSGDEELSGFECALDHSAFTNCDQTYNLVNLAEGSHTLAVRAVDLAKKRDPSPAEYQWAVDTIAPETTITSGPSGLTNRRGFFYFGANEDVNRFECSVDESTFSSCYSGYELPPLPDGDHSLAVRAVDYAGNVDPTAAVTMLTLDTVPPEVEITTAPAPISGSSVVVEFEVGEVGATTRCRIDSQGSVPCESPFEFDGVPDGPHKIAVIATDQAGNEATAVTDEFTVDELPPDTWITNPPPLYTSNRSPSIAFGGSGDAVEYRCSFDEEPFSECVSPLKLQDLADGEHSLRVYSIDSLGHVDESPDSISFTVDTVPPQTTITSAPSGPIHDPVVPFSFESSEALGAFQCAMDGKPFQSCNGIQHDRRIGQHLFEVRALDRAGNPDPTPATHQFTVVNEAPQASLSLDRSGGPAPLQVAATPGGSDGDGDTLSYRIQFGDGESASGELPHDPVVHTFQEPGVYVARLEVDDGFETAVATATVTVGPAEPLDARAGDDRTVVAGEALHFDGGDSRPLRGIGGYQWSFGDGSIGTGATPVHTYAQPGTYAARLTVSRGSGEATDTAAITVVPPAADLSTITVRGSGAPLEGAEVLVMPADGSRRLEVTDADGRVRLRGLADGSYKFAASKPGFLPAYGDLDVSGGHGEGEVNLDAGQTASATVDSHPMTLEEIEAAGIDPNDPDNQHVFQFELHLNLKLPGHTTYKRTVTGMINRGGFLSPDCVLTSTTDCWGTIGGGGGGGYAYIHTTWAPGLDAPILSALVIPFRATFLKEFYDVSMVVDNLASPGFDLRNGTAAIELPSGMSLAPTAKPQSLGVQVPDIPGGGSAHVHWILRGDKEGEYDVAAHYGGTLEPFGRSIALDARTTQPIKVWGGSALNLEVDVDDEVRDRYPYTVFIKLKNVADVPVYNPAVELLREGKVGYIEQPRQQRSFAIRELRPGQTHVAGPFTIVPEPSGEIDLEHSFIRKTAGDVNLGGTIVTHPRQPSFEENPRLEATNLGEQVKLDWEPVPGADGYEVYMTPDRETEFGEEPVHLDPDTATAGLVAAPAAGEQAYYAVSTIIDGRHAMAHPLVEAPPPPPPGEVKEDALGAPKGECPLDRVTLGPAEILASCFVEKGNNVYEATSRVRVNGVDLFPQDARILVDVQQGRILVDRARLQVGNIVLYQGRIDWTARGTLRVGIPDGTVVRGLPVSGSLAISLQRDRAELEANAKLPSALGDKSGRLKLGATNEDGPKLDTFELEANGLSLNGRLGIDRVLLKYNRTSAGDRWEGGATLAIPRPISPLRVQGRLAILNGKFSSASAEVDGINQSLAYGVFLQRLRAAVAVDPLSLSGGIGLSAGPQVLGHEAISIDGDGRATFGNPQVYEVSGRMKVVEAEIASGHLSYRSSGLVEFGGKLGIDRSGFKASVESDGWVDGTRAFNAHGSGTFSVSRASFGAEGVVSSVGIAACRRGSGPDVGAGYRWGGDATFFASSCDIGEFEAVRSRSAGTGDGALRFQVASGEPVEVLAFRGDSAPPRVVLSESDGTRVVAPADGSGIDKPGLMLAQNEEDDTTYVAVYSPPAGAWTVETAPGSAPVTGIRRAGALPAPQAAATVEPAGEEAELHWQLRPIPGQRVEFVERTAHGAQVIATTNSATGTATFTPLAEADGSRRIVAVVEQYGLPRITTAVDSYLAPAVAEPDAAGSSAAGSGAGEGTGLADPRGKPAARPTAPARVRLRRHGGSVVVSWSPVPGAAGYALRGRFSNGRQVERALTGHRFVIPGADAAAAVTVRVRTVAGDGRRSTPRQARLGRSR
jgi:PKD repeat protein